MIKNREKGNTIGIWKIFYTFVLATFHFFNAYGKVTGLYIVTAFFFIVSGYFLAQEVEKGKYINGYQFLLIRVRKYYPHYLLSFLISYVVFAVLKCEPRIIPGGGYARGNLTASDAGLEFR